MPVGFSDIVEQVRVLDDESKRELLVLLRSWLREERREAILRSAEETVREHACGETKSGSLDDLMADLHATD